MGEDDHGPNLCYKVVGDPKVLKRLVWWQARMSWRGILGSAAAGSLPTMIIVSTVVGMVRGHEGTAVAYYSLGAFLANFLVLLAAQLVQLAITELPAESWDCELTDEAWISRTLSGVTTIIPWKALKIVGEHKDAWLVDYGDLSYALRQPLREAGLEEEFKKRIGGFQR